MSQLDTLVELTMCRVDCNPWQRSLMMMWQSVFKSLTNLCSQNHLNNDLIVMATAAAAAAVSNSVTWIALRRLPHSNCALNCSEPLTGKLCWTSTLHTLPHHTLLESLSLSLSQSLNEKLAPYGTAVDSSEIWDPSKFLFTLVRNLRNYRKATSCICLKVAKIGNLSVSKRLLMSSHSKLKVTRHKKN